MTELNTLFQLFNNLSESEKKAFLRKVKILQYNLSLELLATVPIANPCI